MTKCNISFIRMEKSRHFSKTLWDGDFTDWLVEMTSVRYPELSQVVIVQARNNEEAVVNAFFTRNIPSYWNVTEVEEG
jgi:hypothetical protein